jgi:hypothetical protein
MKFRFGGNKVKELQKAVIEKIKPEIEERLRQERMYGNNWKPPVSNFIKLIPCICSMRSSITI